MLRLVLLAPVFAWAVEPETCASTEKPLDSASSLLQVRSSVTSLETSTSTLRTLGADILGRVRADQCDETIVGHGEDYVGCQNKTRSGRQCQRWDAQEPHSHRNTPNRNVWSHLRKNFCRNPDGEPGIWCYTTDPEVRWEFCDACESGCESGLQTASVEPEKEFHDCHPKVLPQNQSDAKCGGRGAFVSEIVDVGFTLGIRGKPGCLRAKIGALDQSNLDVPLGLLPRHAYELSEDASECQRFRQIEELVLEDAPSGSDGHMLECQGDCDHDSDCHGVLKCFQRNSPGKVPGCGGTSKSAHDYCFNPRQLHHGNKGTLLGECQGNCARDEDCESGFHCFFRNGVQNSFNDMVPGCKGRGVSGANYCYDGRKQNTSNVTTDEETSGECNEDLRDVRGSKYRGCQNKTRSGRLCQAWAAQSPHTHSRTAANYPSSGLESNYCRNPDGERSIWCYTTDPASRWELCDTLAPTSQTTLLIFAIDALGRKRTHNGLGSVCVAENGAVVDRLSPRGEGCKFTAEAAPDGAATYSSGSTELEILDDGSARHVGYCAVCEWPYYGKHCERKRPTSDDVDVLIVVFGRVLWSVLSSRITQYQQDLLRYERSSSDVLIWDLPKATSLRPHRELRRLLKLEYIHRHVKTAFLVGDFPASWAVTPGGSHPILSSYTSFTSSQFFNDADCDGIVEPSVSVGDSHWDIAIGILNQASWGEYGAYFDRLHEYRLSGSQHPARKHWTFDEGDWWCGSPKPLYTDGKSVCFDGDGSSDENKREYLAVAYTNDTLYEYYEASAHAWSGGLALGAGLAELWGKPFAGMSFFNLFHCSAARFVVKNLAAMMAISTPHGLASVGTTHTGAMIGVQLFEELLNAGLPWGESMRIWYNLYGKYYPSWHAGITSYGDPMVRMRGGEIRSQNISVDRNGSVGTLRKLEEHIEELETLRLVDENLEKQHRDAGLEFDEYRELQASLEEATVETSTR